MNKIGFIGAGNMASAIIGGIIKSGFEISAYDIATDKLNELSKIGVKPQSSIIDTINCSEIVFLAVKPQNFTDISKEICNSNYDGKVFVSIAAGITSKFFYENIDKNLKIITTMPNTPLLLGKGATAIVKGFNVSDDEFLAVKSIFDSVGISAEITEDKLIDIIPVNGSSPAIIYQFAKDFITYAEGKGIASDVALQLFCQTLIGSAEMMLHSGIEIDKLIEMVCSPGGTTIESINHLKQSDFDKDLIIALEKCAKRGHELSK